MSVDIGALAARAGVRWLDYQWDTLVSCSALDEAAARVCLYYKTGAGKTLTSLACVALWGYDRVLVITPPSTYEAWVATGERLGITVECMSHAKFRMKGTTLSRSVPVIADEFHMFGGHTGAGWKKLDRLAAGLKAPMVLASATPQYNDAERVYCVAHILNPLLVRGGFISFLHKNCMTEVNPYSMTPDVTGFLNYPSAKEFLADLDGVYYLPDDLVYQIEERRYMTSFIHVINVYGYDKRRHRIIASQMEERHTRTLHGLVDVGGMIYHHILKEVVEFCDEAKTPVLVYANHATVAEALAMSFDVYDVKHSIITGKTSTKDKAAILQDFNAGKTHVLIGTASLATGTDGMDKVCDNMIILDDTDDESLRRQLIGRIMPRGLDTDASNKRVVRFNS